MGAYASGEAGGGRCRRAWSERCAAGQDSPLRSSTTSSSGGAQVQDEGATNPRVLTLPNVTLPQSLPQDLPENAGPTGGFAFALPQPHFARLRQQDELHAVSDRAASGAREANEKSRARHAATVPRTKRKLSRLPSIFGKSVPRAPLLPAHRPPTTTVRSTPSAVALVTAQR